MELLSQSTSVIVNERRDLQLSPRELEVLKLLAWGYTNKQIASRLSIKVKTVEAHRYNGMRKTRLSTRADVVVHALRAGWLTLEDPNASSQPSPSGSVSA